MILCLLFESKLWLQFLPYNPIKFLHLTQSFRGEESKNWLCELSNVISDLIQYISENLQAGLGSKCGERVAVSMMCPPHSPPQSHSWLDLGLTSRPGHVPSVWCVLRDPLFHPQAWLVLRSSSKFEFPPVCYSSGLPLALAGLPALPQHPLHFQSSSYSSVGCEVGIRMPAQWLFALLYLILCRNGICWPPLETDQEMECIKSLI